MRNNISKKADLFTESVIREMTRLCLNHNGVNLAQGFPDFPAPAEIKEAAKNAIDNDINQYAITWGSKAFRRAISEKVERFIGIPYDMEKEITVTCGATEAMISSMLAVVNPGEEVIVFEPFYENYGPDAILSGAVPKYISLYPPDWCFDPDELKEAFGENTKAIVINTPHNPTGKVFTKDELGFIANLCAEWDVIAITDEIYEHIVYDGREHLSIASLDGMDERTVTINSISKTYSVTGWRVGWAIAGRKITERIRKVHDFLTVGAPTPFQNAAVAALNMGDSYYEDLRARYLEARDSLYRTLEKGGFKPFKPVGAYYIMTDAEDLIERFGVDDDFAFSRKLIEITGVATVPGSSFYAKEGKGKNQVRFCFCKKPGTLKSVEKRLERLSNYH